MNVSVHVLPNITHQQSAFLFTSLSSGLLEWSVGESYWSSKSLDVSDCCEVALPDGELPVFLFSHIFSFGGGAGTYDRHDKGNHFIIILICSHFTIHMLPVSTIQRNMHQIFILTLQTVLKCIIYSSFFSFAAHWE